MSSSALRQAGSKLRQEGNYARAIALFKYALEKNPDNPFAYVTLGRAYQENNQLLLARESFEQAYQIAESTSHPQVKWVKNFLDRINRIIGDSEQ